VRRFVDVLSREPTASSERDELKSSLLFLRTRRSNEQADRLLDKATDSRSGRRSPILELLEELVV